MTLQTKTKGKERTGVVYDRRELLELLNFSSASLAPESSQAAPAFSSFYFDGERIIAHDDVTATCLPFKTEFHGVVPGHPLLKLLKNSVGEKVEFRLPDGGHGVVSIVCGSSKLSLPFEGEYVFEFPHLFGDIIKELKQDFVDALELCSRIVADSGLSTWLGGVVFDFQEQLTIYSVGSSRNSICVHELDGYGSNKRQRIILPVAFCKLALGAVKRFGIEGCKLAVKDQYATIYFSNDAAVLGRAISGDKLPDLAARIDESLEDAGELVPIGLSLQDAFNRAASMWDPEGDCLLTITDGVLKLRAKVGPGQLNEAVKLKGNHKNISVKTNPKLIARMLDSCDSFQVLDRCVVMTNPQSFTYLVANKSV